MLVYCGGVPNAPAPVKINHPLLFAVGTGLWAAALVALAIAFWGFGQPVGRWVWVCVVGTALGVVAMVYVRHSWRARD